MESTSSRGSTLTSFVQDSNDDVSMAQIANARETFDDLETAYRKFKFELESVRGEHKSEVRIMRCLSVVKIKVFTKIVSQVLTSN